MRDFIKVGLGFIAGALIGGVSMYFYQERKLSAEFETALDAYKASVDKELKEKREFEKMLKESAAEFEASEKQEVDPDIVVNPEDENENDAKNRERMQDSVRRSIARENRSKTNYSNIDSNETENKSQKSREESNVNRKQNIDTGNDKERPRNLSEEQLAHRPKLIEFKEYSMNPGRYIYCHLYYDVRDGYLFDEVGNAVEDIDGFVGYENLELLDNDEEDELYIRNDFKGMMVKVTLSEFNAEIPGHDWD